MSSGDPLVDALNRRISELEGALAFKATGMGMEMGERIFKLNRIRDIAKMLRKETIIGDARLRLEQEQDRLFGELLK